jgi:hypothetical protein
MTICSVLCTRFINVTVNEVICSLKNFANEIDQMILITYIKFIKKKQWEFFCS